MSIVQAVYNLYNPSGVRQFCQFERTRPFDGDGDETAVCDIGAVEYGAMPLSNLYLPLIMKP